MSLGIINDYLFSDNQVRHLDEKSLFGFGQWLVKKWDICQQKKEVAKDVLKELDVDLDTLRQEWAAQVTHQTKPLPKRGGKKATEEVEKDTCLGKAGGKLLNST
ncbi:hypothetical protein BU15DRAFT_82679 [Melanogaster broomeanus]|nr:hypothetical protein BU15DRAFT_82679 [Melanogaster broomeanus]